MISQQRNLQAVRETYLRSITARVTHHATRAIFSWETLKGEEKDNFQMLSIKLCNFT